MSAADDHYHFRTIWISDIHLGTPGCQAYYLLDFLRTHKANTLYLVGDILDGWQLKKSWYWPQAHNDVVQKILRSARKGTKVIYVPGNHDELVRQFIGLHLGGIAIIEDAIHTTADGKRLLVVHGDLFDSVMQHARWLAHLGDRMYTMLLELNRWLNAIRQRLGLPYWSMSQYLKHKVKNAVNFISDFEHVMTEEARRRGCDGVVCGHIHKAEMREINGILYCNDGDWVESLTALAEDFDGKLHLIHWRSRVVGADEPGPHRGRAARGGLGAGVIPLQVASQSRGKMKIMIVTDAWKPQVNGVVRTLQTTARELQAMGHVVDFLTPLEFSTLPCPTYPDIRLSLFPGGKVVRRLSDFDPDALHIATEGPLGMAARRFALRRGLPFTTAYHTRFPEYIHARTRLPLTWTYAFLRWFHGPSESVMVPTQVVKRDLELYGFRNVVTWSRGVDLDIFKPQHSERLQERSADLPVRRPDSGREEYRSLPRAGPSGLEMGCRRGARIEGNPGAVSERELSRCAQSARAGAGIRFRGRLRVSQQDGHVRAGAAGGHGLRTAGRGVSGDRAPGCDRRFQDRRRHA